ncbi:hypothetical protein [Brachybacterium endophyticum]|uniref:hypothetical protein n=1 Tax=Brachybacterium endophyticum TaxID=2182385 RepID=UPI001058273D|nr:hypothetical protein [Brachybacterium endophyticum]
MNAYKRRVEDLDAALQLLDRELSKIELNEVRGRSELLTVAMDVGGRVVAGHGDIRRRRRSQMWRANFEWVSSTNTLATRLAGD